MPSSPYAVFSFISFLDSYFSVIPFCITDNKCLHVMSIRVQENADISKTLLGGFWVLSYFFCFEVALQDIVRIE